MISGRPATTPSNRRGHHVEMVMRTSGIAAAIVTLALGCSGRAETPVLLPLTAAIELPKVEGRFDHFAMDVTGKRLFVAALGNDSLEVIDVAGNKRIESIPNLKKPTGA